jgi:hypothetical protein
MHPSLVASKQEVNIPSTYPILTVGIWAWHVFHIYLWATMGIKACRCPRAYTVLVEQSPIVIAGRGRTYNIFSIYSSQVFGLN